MRGLLLILTGATCVVLGASVKKDRTCKYTRSGTWSDCVNGKQRITKVLNLGSPPYCEKQKTKERDCVPGGGRKEKCKYEKGTWSECDVAKDTQTRTRKLIKGGPQCKQVDTRKRNCKKGCKYTKGSWSECDPITKKMTRILTLQEGGKHCLPEKNREKRCKNKKTGKKGRSKGRRRRAKIEVEEGDLSIMDEPNDLANSTITSKQFPSTNIISKSNSKRNKRKRNRKNKSRNVRKNRGKKRKSNKNKGKHVVEETTLTNDLLVLTTSYSTLSPSMDTEKSPSDFSLGTTSTDEIETESSTFMPSSTSSVERLPTSSLVLSSESLYPASSTTMTGTKVITGTADTILSPTPGTTMKKVEDVLKTTAKPMKSLTRHRKKHRGSKIAVPPKAIKINIKLHLETTSSPPNKKSVQRGDNSKSRKKLTRSKTTVAVSTLTENSKATSTAAAGGWFGGWQGYGILGGENTDQVEKPSSTIASTTAKNEKAESTTTAAGSWGWGW